LIEAGRHIDAPRANIGWQLFTREFFIIMRVQPPLFPSLIFQAYRGSSISKDYTQLHRQNNAERLQRRLSHLRRGAITESAFDGFARIFLIKNAALLEKVY